MNLEPRKPEFKRPIVAGVCQIIAWLSILLSGGMLISGISTMQRNPLARDAGSFFLAAFAVLFSAIFWFALGRALMLLARIEWNTREQ